MNEYQLADLAAGSMSNFLTTFTVFMSIVTAYVVAAFVAGSRLTRIQLVTVNVCFLLSVGAIGSLSFLLFGRFVLLVQTEQSLRQVLPASPLVDFSWAIAVLYLALTLGSLIFMISVRKRAVSE